MLQRKTGCQQGCISNQSTLAASRLHPKVENGTCDQQEQRDTLTSMVQKKFLELLALAKQQTDGIKDTKVLQAVMLELAVTQSSEDAKRVLHEANKP